MSNEKYDAAVAGLALAALDGAQMMIESLRKDKEHVSTELAAARREIASLRERGAAQTAPSNGALAAPAQLVAELENVARLLRRDREKLHRVRDALSEKGGR